ncbi:MAG TPA: chromosome segregation protein SMC [Kofleriaceae bacterium]|nr:chromosome segregation protein SMC [Kofleriaceae bacterium]
MRIKRIEVIGFKSFCDRTVLHFQHPITGVVGPNGCGKSNIVDAIRWCMGEQSAKHLRGQAMGDVIFAGSDTRGAAGMAEVSLTFEDVGFSAETLRLALEEQDDLGDPALAAAEAAEAEALADEGEGEGGGEAGKTGEGETAAGAAVAADASAADAGQQGEAEPEIDVHAATREVQEVLADSPPAIDFSQYSEVTITRRLFRDGTSNYYLNRTPCRLRDITDFFLGTGIGTKAYSIIEQGRVGQIVSSRPQDRRYIIEEAAGITKFKSKKKAAERKLEQTRQNLLRVSDIVSELEKRLGSLRRQAQKAERYRRYRAEMRDLELWMASHRYLEFLAEDQTLRAALTEVSEKHQVARADFEARDARLVAERAELSLEERRLAGMQETIYDRDNRIQLSDSKVAYGRREAAELDERAQAAQGEIRGLVERHAQLAREAEAQRADLEAVRADVGSRQGEVTAREAETGQAREELTGAQRQLDEARALLAAAQADLARAENQRAALAQRRQDTTARLAHVVEETGSLTERAGELERELKRLGQGLADLRQTRLDLGSRAGHLEGRRLHLVDTLDSCEAEVETLRTELHRRRSRLQSLREIHDRYEGFQRGTRAVMQSSGLGSGAAAHGGGDRVETGIHGLVADRIDAPVQLEAAVEAVLGDRLGGILVESHDVGARAVKYLKDTSSGRSAFVPVVRPDVAPASLTFTFAYEDRSDVVAAGEGGEGVMGPMADLVHFDPGYDGLAQCLLSDTIVVDSLERAIDLHKRGVKKTMVTLDGDIVDERGVVSGGSMDAQGAGVLAQKREIRELDEICVGLEKDLTEATGRFVHTKTELGHVTRALDALRHEAHDGDLAITVGEKDDAAARSELDRLRQRTTRLNAEQLELEERAARLDAEQAQNAELEAAAQERRERHEREQLGLSAGVADTRVRVESLQAGLMEARVSLAQLGEKAASLEAAELRAQVARREVEERTRALESSIAEGAARAAELRHEAEELEGGLVPLREERQRLGQEMVTGRAAYDKRTGEAASEESLLRVARHEAEELAGQVAALEARHARLSGDRDHLRETIDERHRVRIERVVGDYHLRRQVGPAEEERVGELKGLIERMGADINLTAIEEYEEISKRHGFLAAQRDDLDDAVGQLERAIAKINRTSRSLFRETFDAINQQFSETFPRLFRGGRAKLALTGDDDDVLEAGVEIMAQPPGKKNSTVDQLSGGEKALTAVALIFAIFLIKPSPFCLLDEVDAPLDDANVDRYNEQIRSMTDRSQFIVITHNKRTMETADHLFGVTMQEPGVSKLVSVNLSRLEDSVAAA